MGSAALGGTDARVSGIPPSSMDLATPPASFTITGNGGFANLGFGLPMVNFMRGTTLLAQARATALTGTTLTVPFPTPATTITPTLPRPPALPDHGPPSAQTKNAPTFSLIGDAALTLTDTRPPPQASGITP